MSIPDDDPSRTLTVSDADAPSLRRVFMAGDTYTILVSGADSSGRLTVIDMHVPPGGGPPPHRHDFEETFVVLEGEVTFTFRGEGVVVRAGTAVNIPANAPHAFRNAADKPARLLCICVPAGQDEFFLALGAPAPARTAAAPTPSEEEAAATAKKAQELLPRFKTEMVPPP